MQLFHKSTTLKVNLNHTREMQTININKHSSKFTFCGYKTQIVAMGCGIKTFSFFCLLNIRNLKRQKLFVFN